MKKFLLTVVCFISIISLIACNKNVNASKEEAKKNVIVFAAASLTESLNEIKQNFGAKNKNINLIFNFDSSGTLKTQIENGAECDIFISAAPKQMNALDITASKEANPSGLDFVDVTTRINLLENKVALCTPKDNKKQIKSFDDLVDKLKNKDVLLAIGNADVPVGQYTQKIFKFYELNETELNKDSLLTYGSNVKEVTSQVKEGIVDCGIVYATDAKSANIEIIDTATKDMCGQVIYPASILKISKNVDEAKTFFEYLKSNEASKVFEKIGFSPIK